MTFELTSHPISSRWSAQHSDRIQLYSFLTPNGVKVSIMLEETALAYEPHLVSLSAEDVKSQEFLSLNPNGKIPAIIDPQGPDGKPLALFESGAILIYLAEKAGMFFGNNASEKAHITQWLMFQMGGVGPMFGQVGYFCAFAGKEIEDPRPAERYINETRRLLQVIEGELNGKDWIAGDFSIADIALVPWLGAIEHYGVQQKVGWDQLPRVKAYVQRFVQRPAVQRGTRVPARN